MHEVIFLRLCLTGTTVRRPQVTAHHIVLCDAEVMTHEKERSRDTGHIRNLMSQI